MADDFEVKIEWEGFDEVRHALRQATKEILDALTAGMIENTEDLLGLSMRDAPIDKGFLRGSGSARVNRGGVARSVKESSADGQAIHTVQEIKDQDIGWLVDLRGQAVIEGEVGFNVPYAADQHEHTEYDHPRGGKAKYLEDNLKEGPPRWMANLASHCREVTHGG